MTPRNNVFKLAKQLGLLLSERHLRCAVAESCTGGALASAVTEIAGSSQWFDRGVVTYTNQSKQTLLAVPEAMLISKGAVSEEVVCAMAQGILNVSDADLSVAVSGIAGPSGGSAEKPVGTVWIAWAGTLQTTVARCYRFEGDRQAVREQAVQAALEGLIHCARRNPE